MPCANPNGSFSSFIASEVLVRYASSDQNRRHLRPPQDIQAWTDAHAVIARADTRNDAGEHMLRQPVRLRIFPINIHLGAVDGGIYVRVAVDADEVIRRGDSFASRTRSARLVALLVPRISSGCAAAQPHLKPRVGPQKIGQIHADTRRSHRAGAVRCLPRTVFGPDGLRP